MNWMKKKSANLILDVRLSHLRITKNKGMKKKNVASERSGAPSKIHIIGEPEEMKKRKIEAERICEEIMAEELSKI